jgi:uncharacterized protein YndB with AHSA1/START domain
MMTNTAELKVTTPSDLEIVITRGFNAPRQIVWEAMSNPEILKRWLFGPPGWSMTVCEGDLRAGGTFHWAWSGPEGVQMAMRGVYREVEAPERVVRTETFEVGCNAQVGEQLASMVLTDEGERTGLILTLSYPTNEARDGALASGLEQGMSAGYNRLDELLSSGSANSVSA